MKTNMDRRAFVESVLVLPLGVFLLRCGGSNASGASSGSEDAAPAPAKPPTVSGPDAVYTSSENSAHEHTFTMKLSDLAAPPSRGLSGPTSEDAGHTHGVSVSMMDLANVQAGQSVHVTTTSNAGHTHVFTFVKLSGNAS